MAIIIQNIDKNLREKGEHLYELRINNQVICEFAHYRENGLSVCLIKAASAARSASSIKSERFDNPHPLADMICQQARTGQPVWYKDKKTGRSGLCETNGVGQHPFVMPDYFDYSFTPFEEEV